MSLQIGQRIWLPCEVKPGPFSDERVVRIPSELGDWLGFASSFSLKDPIDQGTTMIGAVIVDIGEGKFKAKLPGESVTNTLFEGYEGIVGDVK